MGVFRSSSAELIACWPKTSSSCRTVNYFMDKQSLFRSWPQGSPHHSCMNLQAFRMCVIYKSLGWAGWVGPANDI